MKTTDTVIPYGFKQQAIQLWKNELNKDADKVIFEDPAYPYFYVLDTKRKVVMKYSLKNMTEKEVSVTKWKSYRGTKNIGTLAMFSRTWYIDMDTFKVYKSRFVLHKVEDLSQGGEYETII